MRRIIVIMRFLLNLILFELLGDTKILGLHFLNAHRKGKVLSFKTFVLQNVRTLITIYSLFFCRIEFGLNYLYIYFIVSYPDNEITTKYYN